MVANTDFVELYQQLRIRTDCSVAELRGAYRRRIAELHPDRQAAGRLDTADAIRLQELTAAFNAAMTFQRRYGRLPGAAGLDARERIGMAMRPVLAAPAEARPTWPLRFALALGLVIALSWTLAPPDERDDGHPHGLGGFVAPQVATPAQRPAPSRKVDDAVVGHLEYDPSWAEFESGQVDDWQGSPRRPPPSPYPAATPAQ